MNILEKAQNRWNNAERSDRDALFADAVEKTADNIERLGGRFPFIGDGNRYVLTKNTIWVLGYWPAWLWRKSPWLK